MLKRVKDIEREERRAPPLRGTLVYILERFLIYHYHSIQQGNQLLKLRLIHP